LAFSDKSYLVLSDLPDESWPSGRPKTSNSDQKRAINGFVLAVENSIEEASSTIGRDTRRRWNSQTPKQVIVLVVGASANDAFLVVHGSRAATKPSFPNQTFVNGALGRIVGRGSQSHPECTDTGVPVLDFVVTAGQSRNSDFECPTLRYGRPPHKI
jgi:hypothetical protein